MRNRAWKTFSIGPDLPPRTLDDFGISAKHFDHPGDLALRLLEEPSDTMKMIKLFKKMVDVGGASNILAGGYEELIFGEESVSAPGFIVSPKGKDRYVCNLSKKPFFGPHQRGIPKSVRDFTINKGYDHTQTTMGFHGIIDKAVILLALPDSTHNLNVDLKAWFFQIMQNAGMLRYQVKCFPVPLTDDPMGLIILIFFVLMGTEMGNAIAAAAAGGANICIVRAFDRLAQTIPGFEDLLSIPMSKVISPEVYGLKKLDLSFDEFMERFPTKHTNEDKWLHLRYTLLVLWRSSKTKRFPLYMVHQDDVALHNISRNLTARAGRFLYEQYARCKILTSTKFSEDEILPVDIVTGTKLDFKNRLLSLPDEKWIKFTFNVNRLVLYGGSITAGEALSTCGQIMHTADLFPTLRPTFGPLSSYLSGLSILCESDPRKWARAKPKLIEIPAVILCMVHNGWKLIKNREQHATKFGKLWEDADISISTDWCPKGMGFVDHTSGDFEGILIPALHPLRIRFDKNSLFGELFIVTLVLIVFAKRGQTIALSEDNMGCIQAVKKFKSKTTYWALAKRFAQVCYDLELTVVPRYMDTNTIPADPISRTDKSNWKSDFCSRCKALKIPTGRRLTGALDGWTDLWDELLLIERRHSLFLCGL